MKKTGGFDSAVGTYEKFNRYLIAMNTQLTAPLVLIVFIGQIKTATWMRPWSSYRSLSKQKGPYPLSFPFADNPISFQEGSFLLGSLC